MRLYHHKTDGGAEYLCSERVPETDEGSLTSRYVIRIDGDIRQDAELNVAQAVLPEAPRLNEQPETTSLPPDPDGQNDDRAKWAKAAVLAFMAETGTDEADALPDMLADLMHWADREGYDFGDQLHRARRHYIAETAPEPGWNDAPTPPQVVIVIEGGIVQEVLSNIPLDAGILDYDTEGADEDEVFDVPQTGSAPAQACGHIESAAVNPSRVAELLEAINSKPETEERGHRNNPDFCAKCGGVCRFDSDGNPKPEPVPHCLNCDKEATDFCKAHHHIGWPMQKD